MRVAVATSPGQGTAMLAAEPFRCVVLDLGMPTALEFLDQVQEEPDLREVPVVAQAPGEPRDSVLSRLSAYPSLELLPSLDDLRERITLHLSAAQPGQVPALAGTPAAPVVAPSATRAQASALADHPSLRGKHVLVIDDDARNVFAISSTLELHALRVTQASDGRRGIEALRAAPDTDLILMDVMMPGMDGYATMTAIRQMPQFGRLPIIAVTARAMPGDREKSLSAGANDYVTKPVDTDALLACMERWLSKG
jgi:CheY-like chemotaxis protein